MPHIHTIVNDYQHSCTYILYEEGYEYVWLVDCGDANPVKHWLKKNRKYVRGVFLTHCHDDHTFGLRQLIVDVPDLQIFLSAHEGIHCVQDIRMNLSKYTLEPYRVFSEHFVELKDQDVVELFPGVMLTAIQADGHSPDSMVYRVNNYLFTGDAYIPPLPVVTKLPGADKARATENLEKIKELIENLQLKVLAGHSINENQNR